MKITDKMSNQEFYECKVALTGSKFCYKPTCKTIYKMYDDAMMALTYIDFSNLQEESREDKEARRRYYHHESNLLLSIIDKFVSKPGMERFLNSCMESTNPKRRLK